MALLADYAITPDVFDITCHSHEEVCGVRLEALKDVLLSEGLVRDLRNGEWRTLFANDNRPWHRRGKELVRKLAAQGRLRTFAAAGGTAPSTDVEWCSEALAAHAASPLSGGIIVTEMVKGAFAAEPIVGRIDQLPTTPWWASRSSSVRLVRRLPDYLLHLDSVLRCANSIMVIDPHLDPSRAGYRELGNLLRVAGRPDVAPSIEIHRVCYLGSGAARRILAPAEIESSFRGSLEAAMGAAGLKVDVFVWDDFHDRYLISNLVGISVPNGFDTTTNPSDVTTWTRLGRGDRDDIQREFDKASGRHALRHHFTLG